MSLLKLPKLWHQNIQKIFQRCGLRPRALIPSSKLYLNHTMRIIFLSLKSFLRRILLDRKLLNFCGRNFALKLRISDIIVSIFSPTARFICLQKHAYDCELQLVKWHRNLKFDPPLSFCRVTPLNADAFAYAMLVIDNIIVVLVSSVVNSMKECQATFAKLFITYIIVKEENFQ